MAPERRARPKFAVWRYERNLTLLRTAELLERAAVDLGIEGFTCSDQTVHLVCLPFADERRRFPGLKMMAAIGHLTGGEITARDFHAPKQAAA